MTAELAMAIPLLLAVTAGLVWLLCVGYSQVRVVDAARETARAVARGDDAASALAAGRRVAPEGVSLSIAHEGDLVRVTASGRLSGPGSRLPFARSVQLRAEAVALVEEDLDGSPSRVRARGETS